MSPSAKGHSKDQPSKVSDRARSVARAGAWIGATIGVVAAYNHIDAGMVQAMQSSPGVVRSAGGAVSLSYLGLSPDEALRIRKLPDQLEEDMALIPQELSVGERLRGKEFRLVLDQKTEWGFPADRALVRDSSGTVYLNPRNFKRVFSVKNDWIAAEMRASSFRIVSELAESSVSDEAARTLQRRGLPLSFLASSEAVALRRCARATVEEALLAEAPDNVRYAHRLARAKPFEVGNHGIDLRRFETRARFIDRFPSLENLERGIEQPHVTRELDALNVRYQIAEADHRPPMPGGVIRGEIFKDIRREVMHDASLVTRQFWRERMIRWVNGPDGDTPYARSRKGDEIPVALSGVEAKLYATQLLQLMSPVVSDPGSFVTTEMKSVVGSLITALERGVRTSKNEDLWTLVMTLDSCEKAASLVKSCYPKSEQEAYLARLDGIVLDRVRCAMGILGDEEKVRRPSDQLECQGISQVLRRYAYIRGEPDVASEVRSPLQSALQEFEHALSRIRGEQQGVAAPALSRVLGEFLPKDAASRVEALCTSSVSVLDSSRGDEWGEYVRSGEISQILISEWFGDLPREQRAQLLGELGAYSDSLIPKSSIVMLAPAEVLIDPEILKRGVRDLFAVTLKLDERYAAIVFRALLSMPVEDRAECLASIREEQSTDYPDLGLSYRRSKMLKFFSREGLFTKAVTQASHELNLALPSSVIVNRVTRGALDRSSWAGNVDIFASSAVDELTWQGIFLKHLGGPIRSGKTVRHASEVATRSMKDVSLRVSRGAGWVANKISGAIDGSDGRGEYYGVFEQTPKVSLGDVNVTTRPTHVIVFVGEEFRSDFGGISREGRGWLDAFERGHGVRGSLHRPRRIEDIERALRELVRSSRGEDRDELVIVVCAHGSASDDSVSHGVESSSEGAAHFGSVWLAAKSLEESEFKALVNRRLAPRWKRVSIIFDACHSGSWTE